IEEMVEEFEDPDEEPGSRPPADSAYGRGVVCLPAKDRADELAARMVTKVARRRGIRAKTLAATALSAECLSEIEREKTEIVCVSSVPPSGLRQARYLCRRMRSQFPRVKLIIGTWGVKEELNELKRRLATCSPDGLVTSLKQAIEQIVSATAITEQMTPAPIPAND